MKIIKNNIIFIAVTSGDYYMFHETDKNAILCPHVDDEEQTSQQEEPESPETPNIGKVCVLHIVINIFYFVALRIYIFQFIETVMKSDIEEVLKLKETDSSTSDSSKTTPSTPVNNDTEVVYFVLHTYLRRHFLRYFGIF